MVPSRPSFSPRFPHVCVDSYHALQDLIKQLLVVDPTNRLGARSALNHPWIRTDDEILDKRDLTSTVEEMKKVGDEPRPCMVGASEGGVVRKGAGSFSK